MALVPSFDDLYQSARNEIQARRPDLVDWNEGSVLDGVAGLAAVVADEVIRAALARFAELFFNTAEGEALDALALDRFGVVRDPAVAAIGRVRWTRDAAGPYTILAGTRFRATNTAGETITVQSTSAVSLVSADTSVQIPVQATVAGRASNAAADTITAVLDTVPADPGATVTNPEPLAGGADAQTDESFRDTIRRIYSTLRRGTVAALETGAMTVPGVTIVTVDETAVEDSGWVSVYVGDPDGRSNAVLAAAVDAELVNWRAAGVLVAAVGSEREERTVSLQVAIERGADRNVIGAAVRAAIVLYGNTLRAGDRARKSRIEGAAHDASEDVVAVKVTTSADDLIPASAANAIRFVADQITIAFVEV